MLRLEHGKLKIDGHYNQIYQCGAIKAEVHIFLECPSPYTLRQILITNVFKILVEECFLFLLFCICVYVRPYFC